MILIAGNKTDKLSDGSSKRVSFKDGQEVAEVSASTSDSY